MKKAKEIGICERLKDSVSVSKTYKSGIFLIKILCMRKSQMCVPSSLLNVEGHGKTGRAACSCGL